MTETDQERYGRIQMSTIPLPEDFKAVEVDVDTMTALIYALSDKKRFAESKDGRKGIYCNVPGVKTLFVCSHG